MWFCNQSHHFKNVHLFSFQIEKKTNSHINFTKRHISSIELNEIFIYLLDILQLQ